jgi:hypothetical protein
VRYAVDGYGVFSCVIGGMIDKMRSEEVASVVMLVSGAIEPRSQNLVDVLRAHGEQTQFPAIAATYTHFLRGILA